MDPGGGGGIEPGGGGIPPPRGTGGIEPGGGGGCIGRPIAPCWWSMEPGGGGGILPGGMGIIKDPGGGGGIIIPDCRGPSVWLDHWIYRVRTVTTQ